MKTGVIVAAMLLALGVAVSRGAFPEGSWIGLLLLVPLAAGAVLGGYWMQRRSRKRWIEGENDGKL